MDLLYSKVEHYQTHESEAEEGFGTPSLPPFRDAYTEWGRGNFGGAAQFPTLQALTDNRDYLPRSASTWRTAGGCGFSHVLGLQTDMTSEQYPGLLFVDEPLWAIRPCRCDAPVLTFAPWAYAQKCGITTRLTSDIATLISLQSCKSGAKDREAGNPPSRLVFTQPLQASP